MKVADAIKYCIHYHKINSRPNTLANYEFLLGKFGCKYQDRPIDSIATEEIISFLAGITEGRKQNTKRSRYTALSAFFNLITNTLLPEMRNPCLSPAAKNLFQKPKASHWTIFDKDTIVEAIFSTLNTRNRLILELMARGGMRISEVLGLNPHTPAREKKRMIRLLIEDVTMTRGEEILLGVRFKGGATKTLSLPLPLKGWQYNTTDPEIVEIVDDLLASNTYSEIASILNKRGYKSRQGHRFDRTIVKGITHSYKLKTRFARLRATGKLTADEVASLLCVTVATVRRWGKKGTIKTYPFNDRNGCLYEHPGVNSPLMKSYT